MKSYSTAFAFRRALEDRLNAASKAEGVDLQRMRRQVAFDRLLVRLFAEGTRVKDLIDLVLLIDSDAMDQRRLKQDIVDTFQRRETHPVPRALESPPEFWGPVFAKLALECEIDGDIYTQFEKVSHYCCGIL